MFQQNLRSSDMCKVQDPKFGQLVDYSYFSLKNAYYPINVYKSKQNTTPIQYIYLVSQILIVTPPLPLKTTTKLLPNLARNHKSHSLTSSDWDRLPSIHVVMKHCVTNKNINNSGKLVLRNEQSSQNPVEMTSYSHI